MLMLMRARPAPVIRLMALFAASMLLSNSLQADWTVNDAPNPAAPGRAVDFKENDRLVARLIHGEGQLKPYLHVFGDSGDLLTQWSEGQRYPHHRGIFIGWNRIESDIGNHDLWHLRQEERMSLVKLEKLEGVGDSATLVATIEWRGNHSEDSLLITETRTLKVSRPAGGNKAVQVDANFKLKAARALRLGGDLQHAGAHIRVHEGVVPRQRETVYLWSPATLENARDRIRGERIEWCRLLFPIEDRWYAVTQFNSPRNPIEELSVRPYGRFGFFFSKRLAKDETLSLDYRFIAEPAEAPAQPAQLSEVQTNRARTESDARYEAFNQP